MDYTCQHVSNANHQYWRAVCKDDAQWMLITGDSETELRKLVCQTHVAEALSEIYVAMPSSGDPTITVKRWWAQCSAR